MSVLMALHSQCGSTRGLFCRDAERASTRNSESPITDPSECAANGRRNPSPGREQETRHSGGIRTLEPLLAGDFDWPISRHLPISVCKWFQPSELLGARGVIDLYAFLWV